MKNVNKLSLAFVIISSVLILVFYSGCPVHPDTTGRLEPTSTADPFSLVITEIGASVYLNVPSWFEVYNKGTQPINLGNYKLRTPSYLSDDPWTYDNDRTFSIPNLTVLPGEYALIRGKNSPMLVDGAQMVHIIDSSNMTPNWSGTGGFIELLFNGATIDFVRFGVCFKNPTTSGWGSGSAAALPYSDANYFGYSISRDIKNSDTDSPADWTLRAFSTQGGPNDVTSDTDNDMDGIPDCSEVPGSTFAGLPLYDWGARTNQRDIFIQIDYMNSIDPGINPQREALDKMYQAFLSSPEGPIYVHFDIGNLFDDAPGIDPDDYDLSDASHRVNFAKGISFYPKPGDCETCANFYEYKYNSMELARKQVFHYMLFANSQNEDGTGGSSGIAEMRGDDVTITLGSSGLKADTQENKNLLINFQAATMMHEFGHNLGLSHGGDEEQNYKPNYLSIMNYMYQLGGLPVIGNNEGDRYYWYQYSTSGRTQFAGYFPNGFSDLIDGARTTNFHMNYSEGTSNSLNENSLSEPSGLGRPGSSGVDWNDDTDTIDTGLSIDLNIDSDNQVLNDYNDWANIDLLFIRKYNGVYSGILPSEIGRRKSLTKPLGPVGDELESIAVETLIPKLFISAQ